MNDTRTLTTDDLANFRLFTSPSELSGTCYFEFCARVFDGQPTCWNDGSLFVADTGFDFFAALFERASSGFDYFAFTHFDRAALDRLIAGFDEFLRHVAASSRHEDLLTAYAGCIRAPESWGGVTHLQLATALTQAGTGIRDFARRARDEHGGMWVLGM